MTLEEMSSKLDELLGNDNNYFVSKTLDNDELPLWKEYEVGSGAGNREGIIQEQIVFLKSNLHNIIFCSQS